MNNDIVFTCPQCKSNNHYYGNYDRKQLQLEYKKIKCKFCGIYFKLNQTNFNYDVLKNKGGDDKMLRKKQEVGGTYLKPDKDTRKGGKETYTILGEGRIDEGQYGERLIIPVASIDGIEKDFNLSPTNENKLIEKFGGDTKAWIDKEIEILYESCNVGQTGLKITILD